MPSKAPARFVYVLLDLAILLIGLRIVLKLLGASVAADFTRFIYGLSDPLVSPFTGLLSPGRAGNIVLEWPAIIAVIAYVIAAYAIVRVIGVFGGHSRKDDVIVIDEGGDDFEEE